MYECRNCKFFEDSRCHRYPPIIDSFQTVLENDWCGEFSPNVVDVSQVPEKLYQISVSR